MRLPGDVSRIDDLELVAGDEADRAPARADERRRLLEKRVRDVGRRHRGGERRRERLESLELARARRRLFALHA